MKFRIHINYHKGRCDRPPTGYGDGDIGFGDGYGGGGYSDGTGFPTFLLTARMFELDYLFFDSHYNIWFIT